MVDNLAKACGTKKIIVLFSENTDLVSNIYTDLFVLCSTKTKTNMKA